MSLKELSSTEILSNIEIERKFLVDREGIPLDLDSYNSVKIVQHYLRVGDTEERVRSETNEDGETSYVRTLKRGTGRSREEEEWEISEDEYLDLAYSSNSVGSIEKTRYEIPFRGFTVELDIYEVDLKGLITAEVEFENEDSSTRFNPPDWFSTEVTEDSKLKNQSLATVGLTG